MRCEDYPCCGHTNDDPCAPQWYDRPDAFDTTVNPHAFCEHEYGICDVEPEDEDDYPDDEEEANYAMVAEDAFLDGSWEM